VTDLLQRVEQNIQNRGLFKQSGKILVAVSGGLDSMVLLHALGKLSAEHRRQIVVAHFNHRLRGRASDADEKLVRKTAAAMKLRAVVENADVKGFAAKSKLSIEMAARKLRHEFLARAAKRNKIKIVALAHHADDQVELFFLRLLRGAGGEGLAGMKWQSPSPVDLKITLVRPLLDSTKAELFVFAHENRIRFRDDASNYSNDFLRNRIRNQLLPLLRKNYQPALGRNILRLMEIIGAESDFVGRVASSLRGTSVWRQDKDCIFDNLPAAIQRRVLQQRLMKLDVPADFELIEHLRGPANRFISVSCNLSVSRDKLGEVLLRAQPSAEFCEGELRLNLSSGAGQALFGSAEFNWHFSDGSRGHLPRQVRREFFDADKVGSNIVLRYWRPGDRFQPIGLQSPAKLQDLFMNAKIPRDRRRKLLLAESSGGEIFWVEGLRIAENFKLTPRTKRCLIWRWQHDLP
jgi:tRNA(Ile)-lysidine synthase